ncbi:hypothetical protein ASC96_27625 [Rhizobium sp. Root1204]|nr:hypothetical protein ASC96_27625 [Rhizobium sp. Root1204]
MKKLASCLGPNGTFARDTLMGIAQPAKSPSVTHLPGLFETTPECDAETRTEQRLQKKGLNSRYQYPFGERGLKLSKIAENSSAMLRRQRRACSDDQTRVLQSPMLNR